MNEIWKISQYNKNLSVSNLGRIKSNLTGNILKCDKTNSGYLNLKYNNCHYQAHRLVAREFCGGYQECLVVNHKDANKLNNRADNLEWVTQKGNVQDMINRGTLNTQGARDNLKLEKEVIQYDMTTGEELARYPSLKEASKVTGAQASKISMVAHGKRNSAGGYHWGFSNPNDNYTFIVHK